MDEKLRRRLAAVRDLEPVRSTRTFGVESEVRAVPGATSGDRLVFRGYASTFEDPYPMYDAVGEYTEVVDRGAFARTLAAGPDVPFLVNHAGVPLARTKSGTLRLGTDEHGLHVEADLDTASPLVVALRSAVERGDLDDMSFAFRIRRRQWSPDYDELRLLEVDLHRGDVSVVTSPANEGTAGATVSARALPELLHELDDDALRDVLARGARLLDERAPTPRRPLSLYAARAAL